MKKYAKHFIKITVLPILAAFFVTTIALQPAQAAVKPCDTSGAGNTEVCRTSKEDLTSGILGSVISILLYVAGTIAVIMIIVGAIRYITSDGDSNKASQARNTIIYAVVGLVVAIMSFGIVNFVIGKL